MDILQIPAHSLIWPLSFAEKCQVANKDIPDAVIAIVNNNQKKKPASYSETIMLSAKIAWRIDEHLERFATMPLEHLSCTVSGDSIDFKN